MKELIIWLIVIHWGYATGSYLAWRTDWSIEKFSIIILLIWILTKNRG